MTKLDWSRARSANSDPGRVVDVGDYGAYAEVKSKVPRKPGRTRAEIEAIEVIATDVI